MPVSPLPVDMAQFGLAALLEAFDLAQQLHVNPRDFALELSVVVAAGLSRTHLRWLICKGYVLHGTERAVGGKGRRLVRRIKELSFQDRSCFALTAAGAELIRPICSLPDSTPPTDIKPKPAAVRNPDRPQRPLPHWDNDRRGLTVDGEIVIRFTGRRGILELILAAFEEDAWRHRIDDPLPVIRGHDAKTRLRGAIEKLNHKRIVPVIVFSGDGDGEGVCWEFTSRPI